MSDYARRVKKLDEAETVALRTGSDRIVERKQARFQLGQRVATRWTGKARRKQIFLSAVNIDSDGTVFGVEQSGFERFGNAPALVRPYLQAVDDDFNRVATAFPQ